MALIYIASFIGFDPSELDIISVKKEFPQHEIVVGGETVDPSIIDRIEIAFGFLEPEVLERMPNLKWLHLPSAGVDPFIGMAKVQSGEVMLTNSHVYGTPISEHILAMFLSMKSNMHLYRDDQHNEIWNPISPEKEFAGSIVGILGFGDIGKVLAEKCRALGAKVLALKNTPSEKPDYVERIYTIEQIDEMLPECDFLALCLPGTEKTKYILSKERIDKLKDGVFVVNVGRGSAIDQLALAGALRSGKITAAGLDVTDPEPLPEGNELWRLKNCIITPHASGRSPGNKQRILNIFISNLRAYKETGSPGNVITAEKGY